MNFEGRKNEGRSRGKYSSIYIPEEFNTYWEGFKKLASQENSNAFIEYCKKVEKIDVNERNQGFYGLVMRWLISTYVYKNIKKPEEVEKKDVEENNKKEEIEEEVKEDV